MLRTHTNNELGIKELNKQVKLCGWVQSSRDHGGIIFIDLRDRYGITQLVFDPEHDGDIHKNAESLRREDVKSPYIPNHLEIPNRKRNRPLQQWVLWRGVAAVTNAVTAWSSYVQEIRNKIVVSEQHSLGECCLFSTLTPLSVN